jgi:hypothetical protein
LGNRAILSHLVIPIPSQDLMEIILLARQNTDPARTRPWGWKGHCRVLRLNVFLKTGGKYDDKIVLRGYGSDFHVLLEKHPGICPIVLTPAFHILPIE